MTMSATAWKKEYKDLSQRDLDYLREMFAKGDYNLFYQEAGSSDSGTKKYRLFLIDSNGSPVKRGAPVITDVTHYLSNMIGNGYSTKDGTVKCYPSIQQWHRVLMDKLGFDIRTQITMLSFV